MNDTIVRRIAAAALDCFGNGGKAAPVPFRARKRNESAIQYLYAALHAKTRQVPNLDFVVACPAGRDHCAIVLWEGYLHTGHAVLRCLRGCPEGRVLARLGVRDEDLHDVRRFPALVPAARRSAG